MPASVTPLTGSASNRRYCRLASDAGSCIGVIGTDVRENNAFVAIARHFRAKGINVPEVYAVSDDKSAYLQEDLGDCVLFDIMDETLLCKAMSMLPAIQYDGAEGLDFSVCYPQPSFDRRMVMFDLNYFKYCFLKPSGLEFDEVLLQDDFERFADALLEEDTDTFLYRDFNARNVMICDNEPYFIDFQGGRRGPIYYDVASFVWQARAKYPSAMKERMLDSYLEALAAYRTVDRDAFMSRLDLFILFRLLQVLGAYGFRGLIEHKANFVTSIPAAISELKAMTDRFSSPYPYLAQTLERLCALPRFEELPSDGVLEVRVCSFSFKKGIPQDPTGNGGGYVFDCRSIHNPGRYEPYKKLTGMDEPVIRFLEDDGEVFSFLEHVYGVVDPHVETYARRGFSSLMVSFGCTGGQHRSVYCAEHLAAHLREKYPDIRVRLRHREQDMSNGMKAMIFAAGLGTRLKPITDTLPKALVPVGGKPLIEHVARKLKASGIEEVVVNVHHFADKVEAWIGEQDIMKMEVSDERRMLLETGGAVLHARRYLEGCGHFLIHNVDIMSNADLKWFEAQVRQGALATLLVSNRPTKRFLLFEPGTMRLVGWHNTDTGDYSLADKSLKVDDCLAYGFSGIHIMSDKVFALMDEYVDERGLTVDPDAGVRFPIMSFYLWAALKMPIYGVVAENLDFLDVGKLDTLAQAEEMFRNMIKTE